MDNNNIWDQIKTLLSSEPAVVTGIVVSLIASLLSSVGVNIPGATLVAFVGPVVGVITRFLVTPTSKKVKVDASAAGQATRKDGIYSPNKPPLRDDQ